MHPQDLSIHDFTYTLPDERIARFPLAERDASKLLVYRKGNISETVFHNLPDLLQPGDLLVFNHTRVVQARLVFQNANGARIEVFCLEPDGFHADIPTAMIQRANAQWKCLVGQARKWKEGEVLKARAGELELEARLLGREPDCFRVAFSWTPQEACFADVLEAVGQIPLPPYLKREPVRDDSDRYQTVYAREKGSVAAPTAGLHFTPKVMQALEAKGVARGFLTLHVGAGTFRPVKAERMEGHVMHEEEVIVSRALLAQIASLEGSVAAVGTTSLRSLESVYWTGLRLMQNPDSHPEISVQQWEPYSYTEADCLPAQTVFQFLVNWMASRNMDVLKGITGLLIAPGYRIRVAQKLVTNFHQPQSTLLLLVSACIGEDWKKVYDYALANDFRFLSFGDSSLLEFGQ
jgi:S-adenosylmethionine:tRNA ribosyltransferase-isomerase